LSSVHLFRHNSEEFDWIYILFLHPDLSGYVILALVLTSKFVHR